jgi:LysM repeat protein
MNYEQALADKATQQDKANRDEINARGWRAILNKYTLRDTAANFAMLVEWANPLTLEAFEELLRSKPKGLTLDATSREQLIDEIVKNSHGDQNTLRNLKVKLLSTYSLTQLRDARRGQEFKSRVRTKEQAEAHVAKAHRDTSWNGTGYPKLQATLVPPGQVVAVKTGDFLRKIAREDVWLLKRYVRIYGSSQIDWWLQN